MIETQLIVALDVPDREQALRLRDELADVVEWFKVGKELFTREGPDIVRVLGDVRIFLDLKFHDIPNTVAGAMRCASSLGVHLVDVHTSGGVEMMRQAHSAARQARLESSEPGSGNDPAGTPIYPKVFGVTVLTSLDENDLASIGVSSTAEDQVVRLARLADQAGLDGVVASAHEMRAIQEATEGRLELLIPGIRPEWAEGAQDQVRVATPFAAARAGASYIVVGRPIRNHPVPREAALRILDELSRAGD